MTTVYEILERFNNYNPNVKLTPIQIQEIITQFIEHEKQMLEQAWIDGKGYHKQISFELWYNAKT